MSRAISRRDALKLATAAGGGFIGLLLSIPAIGFLLTPLFAKTRESWVSLGSIDDIPIGTPTPRVISIPTGEGWETPAPERVVYILRKSQDSVSAIANICTHMQCPVHWDTDRQQFLCPCHGGLYDRDGRNVGGPPPQPLPQWVHRTRRDAQGRTVLEVSNRLDPSI